LAFDIHLYITDHKDELPDLHTMKHVDEVRSWFSQVDDVCVHHDHFKKIDDDLLKEAKNHPILHGFAVVFYPMGEMLQANAEVGQALKRLFHKHRIKFSSTLTPNENLNNNFYDVYLELIVGKEEGEEAPKKEEPKKEEDKKLSLADKEKMLLGDLHPEAEKKEEPPVKKDTRSLEEKILGRLNQ
jgi:hypothetical protein